MSLNITVTGDSRRLRFDWEAAAGMWAARVGPVAREAVRSRAPVSKGLDPKGPKPGRLRDSINDRYEHTAGLMSVIIYATAPYAKFVIRPTRPHPIRARNVTALHWVDEGGDHFARSVRHPGTKGNPFPEKAITSIQPLLIEQFARACKEAMR